MSSRNATAQAEYKIMKEELSGYDSISLEEMKGIRLMNRIDTKFVTTIPILEELLRRAQAEYYVQETEGRRMMHYNTLYFDTADHDMYITHQNGKKNRQKIRVRSYSDSGIHFLEVKNKNCCGRTKKKRVSVSDRSQWNIEGVDFLNEYSRYQISDLHEQIENSFQRITLVNKGLTERITIDVDLKFHNFENDCRFGFPELAIIELKRDGNTYSPIKSMLRDLRIKPSKFSKYCIGCAKTDPMLKQNRFKPLFCYLDKLIRN